MPVQANPEGVLCRQESVVPAVEGRREGEPASQNQSGEDQDAYTSQSGAQIPESAHFRRRYYSHPMNLRLLKRAGGRTVYAADQSAFCTPWTASARFVRR